MNTPVLNREGATRKSEVVRGALRSALIPALLIAAVASVFVALISYNYIDRDIWHEMALIRSSIRAGHLLTHDIFAYTPTVSPLVHHEWGSGVIAYFITQWLGGFGLVLLKHLVALATLGACILCARAEGADIKVVALLAPVGIYLMHGGFLSTIRAQAYTFLFTAVLLYVLTRDKRGWRRWIVPWLLVFPLWVNLHGGFVVGIGVVILHAIEEAIDRRPYKHLLLVAAVMCLATLATPYGLDYVGYLWRALTMPRPHISEWDSVYGRGAAWSFFLLIAIGTAAASWMFAYKRSAHGLLVLLATAIQGMLHFKLLPLFAIAWLCYVPSKIQETKAGQRVLDFIDRRRLFVMAAALSLLVAGIAGAVRQKFWISVVPQGPAKISYPVQAVRYLVRNNVTANLMVPFAAGAYVSWKTDGRVRVSVDSRYEVAYREEWVSEVFNLYDAKPGWQVTLSKYPTDLILVPNESALSIHLPIDGWHRVFADPQYQLYARAGFALPEESASEPLAFDVIP